MHYKIVLLKIDIDVELRRLMYSIFYSSMVEEIDEFLKQICSF